MIFDAEDPKEEFISIRDLYDKIYPLSKTKETLLTSKSFNPAYISDDLRCNSLTLKVKEVSLNALTKELFKRPQIFIKTL